MILPRDAGDGAHGSASCPCECCIFCAKPNRYCISYLLRISDYSLIADIKTNFVYLERAVAQFDARFTLRALRSISSIRKRLSGEVIAESIIATYPPNNGTAQVLLRATGLDGEDLGQIARRVSQANTGSTIKAEKKEPLPEVDVYIAILAQVCSCPLTTGVQRHAGHKIYLHSGYIANMVVGSPL